MNAVRQRWLLDQLGRLVKNAAKQDGLYDEAGEKRIELTEKEGIIYIFSGESSKCCCG